MFEDVIVFAFMGAFFVSEKGLVLSTYKEITPIILLTIVAEIWVGVLLIGIEDFYELLPGLFIIVPGLMEARGNISGALGQRLGSAIHLGVVSWEDKFNEEVSENVKASISLGLLMSVFLGVLAFLSSILLGFKHMSLFDFVLIAVLTSVLAGVTQVVFTVFIATYSSHLGLDPDNVTIPALSVVGDILTIMYLLLTAKFVLFVS